MGLGLSTRPSAQRGPHWHGHSPCLSQAWVAAALRLIKKFRACHVNGYLCTDKIRDSQTVSVGWGICGKWEFWPVLELSPGGSLMQLLCSSRPRDDRTIIPLLIISLLCNPSPCRPWSDLLVGICLLPSGLKMEEGLLEMKRTHIIWQRSLNGHLWNHFGSDWGKVWGRPRNPGKRRHSVLTYIYKTCEWRTWELDMWGGGTIFFS